MKHIIIIFLLFILGCSEQNGQETPQRISKTLNNLHFDSEQTVQYPLVCGKDMDFSEGNELLFISEESNLPVHAVFPKDVEPPKNLSLKVSLNGHFQQIQNLANYQHKKPQSNYQYFVVSAWQYND